LLDPALSHFHLARALQRLGREEGMLEAISKAELEIDQVLKSSSPPANHEVVKRASQLRQEIGKLRRRPPEPPN
jgi:hypothetical protein